MNIITRQMAMAHLKVRGAFDRMTSNERGQGTIEYVGIVLAVVVLVGVVVAVFQEQGAIGQWITTTFPEKITTLFDGLGG
ncbi:MAG: hypothetical protein FWF02_06165 [Micrococcales bacterium]|nr:hypothetical protein [Micrococcales bacterium]MCL2667276.1 hypothetical protein [Micrococcales bacterium]